MIEGFLLTPFLYPRALDNKMSLTPRNVFDNEWAESFLIPGSSRNRVNLRSDFNWGTWQENVSSFAYRLQRREFISFRDEIISWRVKVGILKLNENWNHSSVEMIFIHQINFKLCSELKSSIRNAIVRIHFSCTVLSSLLFFFTEKIFSYQLITSLFRWKKNVHELDFEILFDFLGTELCSSQSCRFQVWGWSLPKPHGDTRVILHRPGLPAAGKSEFFLRRVLINLLLFNPVFSSKVSSHPQEQRKLRLGSEWSWSRNHRTGFFVGFFRRTWSLGLW